MTKSRERRLFMFHVHTNRCGHATGKDEEYIERAIALGEKQIIFTDHTPFPEDAFPDLRCRMGISVLPEYIKTMKRLKKIYEKDIEVVYGLEIEWLNHYKEFYKKLKEQTEILIVGEHIIEDSHGNIQYPSTFTDTRYFKDYAENIKTAALSGLVHTIAHPDRIFLKGLERSGETWNDDCEECVEIMLFGIQQAIGAGKLKYVELNAGSFRSLKTAYNPEIHTYPNKRMWQAFVDAKLPIIIGQDAHAPKELMDIGYERAKEFLADLGGEAECMI